jgi:hypothetical protein
MDGHNVYLEAIDSAFSADVGCAMLGNDVRRRQRHERGG